MHHIQPEMHLRLKALKFNYVADTTLWPKATWGGEGLFDLHIQGSIYHWGKTGQVLKVETQMQETQRKSLLAKSLVGSQAHAYLAFLYNAGPPA